MEFETKMSYLYDKNILFTLFSKMNPKEAQEEYTLHQWLVDPVALALPEFVRESFSKPFNSLSILGYLIKGLGHSLTMQYGISTMR